MNLRLARCVWDSPDQVIREVQPVVKSGRKWTAEQAVTEAEASLRTKDIVGAVQDSRAGLGNNVHRWFSAQGPKGRREMVIEEVRAIDEERRSATAAGFAKQCAWSCWEEAEQRKLSWPTLAQMEPLRISFLLRSTYDLLPTPTNLKQWGIIDDDICRACNQTRATLEHVLTACNKSLQKYTWRHNRVLRVIAEATQDQCASTNKAPVKEVTNQGIKFHREGEQPQPAAVKRAKQSRLLKGAQDWQMLADLSKALHFPCHIAITTVRPDIVIWSDSRKCVHLVELTVPWEGNFDFANERKRTRYEPLRASCEDRGWACSVIPVEVGCRGFIARSTRSFLSNIGLPKKALRATIKALQEEAEAASNWIWQSSRSA